VGSSSFQVHESIFISSLDQKNLVDRSFIVKNIALGETYFETLSQSISQTFGEINIARIIIINQIIEYLIELIAGFVFSSFQPDNISITHHHIKKKTASIHENKTTKAIATLIISSSSYAFAHAIQGSLVAIAFAISINISNNNLNL